MSGKRNLVVFDWDGTLHRRHVVEKWYDGLIRRGFLPKGSLAEARRVYRAHLRREASFDDYTHHLVTILKTGLAGVDAEAAMEIGREIVRREERHLYVFTRLLLEAAVEAGFEIAVISGSPIQIVQPFAEAHGITHVFATTFVEGGGKLTGELKDDWIIDDGKARALVRLAIQLGLDPNKDLKESLAIGDTVGDVPMLKLVGHPICFNTSRGLVSQARAQKKPWPRVTERKDVCTILTWYNHTPQYHLCETPNPIVPYDLAKAFLPRFHAHFG